MRRFHFLLLLLTIASFSTNIGWSQVASSGIGPVSFGSFGDEPVEITADGETRFEGGVAIAENNVQIHRGGTSIYSDYAEYDPDTREVLLIGNVRIYTKESPFVGQRAIYNMESKQVRALEFAGEFFPLRFRTLSMRAPSMREFRVSGATLTTDDDSQPSYYIKSRTMRIYPDDRVVFLNSALYIKNIPVLWFPYLYSNLDTTGFTFLPGYYSAWGGYLLTSYGFPIGSGKDAVGTVRLDFRTKRGVAMGFDADMKLWGDARNKGKFESYHAWDTDPSTGAVGGTRSAADTPESNRYRVAYKQTLFLADDIYAKGDINVLSDRYFLEDFFPAIARVDPQPDNYIGLTKWSENYTLNLIGRWQVNDFQQYTERLPELVWDIKNQRIFGSPIFYSGETGVASLKRAFASYEGSTAFPDYDSFRFDTFHQFSAPFQLFKWWSIVPTAGFRATYYNKSGTFQSILPSTTVDSLGNVVYIPGYPSLNSPIAAQSSPLNTPTPDLQNGGAILRPVFNFGIEQSFKLSKAYEKIQARWLGIDGIRHVVQPYTNLSVVINAGAPPTEVLQFDRIVPSTQLLPLTFPEFTATDSIGSWAIMRFGTRQSLQTRRNNGTFEWFSLDTFFDANMENPYSNSPLSNLFNVVNFKPVPWASLAMRSQIPLTPEGFSEFDTRVSFQPVREFSFSVGQAYINGNEFFQNSNQLIYSAYWRLTDNWSFSFSGQYEAEKDLLMYQNYMVHRDLSSWILSFGAQVLENEVDPTAYGVVFALTLKDAPQITLPFAFDASTTPLAPGGNSNSNSNNNGF